MAAGADVNPEADAKAIERESHRFDKGFKYWNEREEGEVKEVGEREDEVEEDEEEKEVKVKVEEEKKESIRKVKKESRKARSGKKVPMNAYEFHEKRMKENSKKTKML